MQVFCECDSYCTRTVEMSVDEQLAIRQNPRHIIIVKGCPKGPSPSDVLVEERETYTIYKAKY